MRSRRRRASSAWRWSEGRNRPQKGPWAPQGPNGWNHPTKGAVARPLTAPRAPPPLAAGVGEVVGHRRAERCGQGAVEALEAHPQGAGLLPVDLYPQLRRPGQAFHHRVEDHRVAVGSPEQLVTGRQQRFAAQAARWRRYARGWHRAAPPGQRPRGRPGCPARPGWRSVPVRCCRALRRQL